VHWFETGNWVANSAHYVLFVRVWIILTIQPFKNQQVWQTYNQRNKFIFLLLYFQSLTSLKEVLYLSFSSKHGSVDTLFNTLSNCVQRVEVGMFLAGVNFNNILWPAFTRVDPKSAKRHWCLFVSLGSACVKALHKTLVKLTPGYMSAPNVPVFPDFHGPVRSQRCLHSFLWDPWNINNSKKYRSTSRKSS